MPPHALMQPYVGEDMPFSGLVVLGPGHEARVTALSIVPNVHLLFEGRDASNAASNSYY